MTRGHWSDNFFAVVGALAAAGKTAGYWFLYWLAFLFLVGFVIGVARAEPLAARQYRNDLIREARAVWGLTAPIALFAGQIEQESAWRPNVCSPYACGLTQFTKDTAEWIAGRYGDLSSGDRFNPQWAMRAMVRYDHYLYAMVPAAAEARDRFAFVLSGYNGGLGNLRRDIAICMRTPGCDALRWFGHVELYSNRAAWAFKENRGYPRVILDRRQFTYSHWGPTV